LFILFIQKEQNWSLWTGFHTIYGKASFEWSLAVVDRWSLFRGLIQSSKIAIAGFRVVMKKS